MSQDFQLLKDPRIITSDAELEEQLELLLRIQGKLDELVLAVNRSRGLRKQLDAWSERLGDQEADSNTDLIAEMGGLVEKLEAVEAQLVQAELTSPGDSLNYREQLFEKLGALNPVVSSADKPPTKQSLQVFDKLAGQVDDQLGALDQLLEEDLAAVNQRIAALGVDIIGT